MDRYFVKTILLIVFLLSACFSGKASAAAIQDGSDKPEVILISDIDDTIENSHVRAGDKLRSLGHVLNYHDDFFGMSLLYRALAENGVRVVYVSGMPKLLDRVTGGATNFLRDNSFPGEEILRQSTDEDTYTFKVRTITAYLEDLQQKEPNKKFHVIAPGDNGEQDIRVLDTVSKNFPNVKFDLYIHKVYENDVLKILPEESAFYTAADLAVQIYNSEINQGKKILNQDQMANVFAEVQSGLSDSDPDTRSLVIPHWAELTDQDEKNIKALMAQSPAALQVASQILMTSIQSRIGELDGAGNFSEALKLNIQDSQCKGVFKQ